jgi:ubiquinone/menaquinone biosynthesis C-methylase UbiE
MNHTDHVNLLRHGVPASDGSVMPERVWADLGAGAGAFTLALAELIGGSGSIYAIDNDANALRENERTMRARFPTATVHYRVADFTRSLRDSVPPLDGIVMANALHFLRDKDGMVQLMRRYLKSDGRLILVEYNVDQGNLWVPHPLSYTTWEALARRHGFRETQLLATQPSRFLGQMYAALSLV